TPRVLTQAEGGVIQVGPEPYDITATDDPEVMLLVDRVDDSRGVGVLRTRTVNDTRVSEINYVSLVGYGMVPRLIEGRSTQVFGVSNANSIVFVRENAMAALIGPHPSYAFITGYNKFVQGHTKHDPSLVPLEAYNYYYRDPHTGQVICVPLAAGGNIGVIRNPLRDFSNLVERPRLVAATTPVVNGFPESISLSQINHPQTNEPLAFLLNAGFQAINRVFIYNAAEIVSAIEAEAASTDFIPSFSQTGEPVPIPASLSRLLRGPLSSVPIDVVVPTVHLKSLFGFYKDPVTNETVYGAPIPEMAPLLLGRLPRGVSSPHVKTMIGVQLSATPYNEAPTLSTFPNEPLRVEAGFTSTANVHTGAYQYTHNLVSTFSLQERHQLTLAYDSLTADPLHIYYFSVGAVGPDAAGSTFIVRLTVRNDQGDLVMAEGLAPEDAAQLGLNGGELLFKLPASIPEGETFGAGIPIDLSELPTGLYTVVLEYGLFRQDAEGKFTTGRFFTRTEPYAVVNHSESAFGAGWGL